MADYRSSLGGDETKEQLHTVTLETQLGAGGMSLIHSDKRKTQDIDICHRMSHKLARPQLNSSVEREKYRYRQQELR